MDVDTLNLTFMVISIVKNLYRHCKEDACFLSTFYSCHIFVKLTPAKQVHVDSDSGEVHELDTKETALKSDREALKLADMLLEYSRYHGKDDLSLAISKVNDLLQMGRL